MTTAAYILATRPKTLTTAFVPILVGTLLATGPIDWMLAACALACAFFIQIGTNFINDALDFKNGVDTAARIGPQRATQSGLLSIKQVYLGGLLCFLTAAIVATPLLIKGGMVMGVILAVSILCGYIYTGGPFPLSYVGLGDVFVFVFFGIVATMGTTYIQSLEWTWTSFLAGCEIGLLSTVLIAINNMRDVHHDAVANKKTIPVRFGLRFARMEMGVLLFLPFALNMLWFMEGRMWAAILPLFTLPFAGMIMVRISKTPPSKQYNKFLAEAALLHMGFGVLLAIGL